jgi:hypothetical protein
VLFTRRSEIERGAILYGYGLPQEGKRQQRREALGEAGASMEGHDSATDQQSDRAATSGGRAHATLKQQMARLLGHGCDVCGRRIVGSGYYFEETEPAPEPRRMWTLCEACAEMAQREVERTSVRSPLRLRIAMGIVASERGSGGTPGREVAEDDSGFNRWLVAVVWIAFAVHALAFILVAAVIAAEH